MKLSNSNRTIAIAAAAILMSAYQLSPIPAWACSASTSGGFAYSSNTGPTSVTVCAKSVANTRTAAVAPKAPASKAPASKAPATPAAPKPTPKPAPIPTKSLMTPIKQGVPAALQKPVAKPAPKPAPKPLAAPIAKKVPTNNGDASSIMSSTSASGEVSFSPAPISLAASQTSVSVGQEVSFWANSSTHYKSGVLLGKVTDVRFTPIQTVWISEDGQTGVGGSISFAFADSGSIEVFASVTYAVSYQIAGASGWVSSGEISVSDSIAIRIDEAPELLEPSDAPPTKVVRLVGKNCTSQRAAFGCSP